MRVKSLKIACTTNSKSSLKRLINKIIKLQTLKYKLHSHWSKSWQINSSIFLKLSSFRSYFPRRRGHLKFPSTRQKLLSHMGNAAQPTTRSLEAHVPRRRKSSNKKDKPGLTDFLWGSTCPNYWQKNIKRVLLTPEIPTDSSNWRNVFCLPPVAFKYLLLNLKISLLASGNLTAIQPWKHGSASDSMLDKF